MNQSLFISVANSPKDIAQSQYMIDGQFEYEVVYKKGRFKSPEDTQRQEAH